MTIKKYTCYQDGENKYRGALEIMDYGIFHALYRATVVQYVDRDECEIIVTAPSLKYYDIPILKTQIKKLILKIHKNEKLSYGDKHPYLTERKRQMGNINEDNQGGESPERTE